MFLTSPVIGPLTRQSPHEANRERDYPTIPHRSRPQIRRKMTRKIKQTPKRCEELPSWEDCTPYEEWLESKVVEMNFPNEPIRFISPEEWAQLKEEDTMIKLQRTNAPTGGATPRGVQFLSPRHLTNEVGHKAQIYRATTNKPDNFGNPYVVYFEMDGTKYSKGFKATSDGLAQLCDVLGTDEKKWVGKSVIIGKKVDDDNGERLTYSEAK